MERTLEDVGSTSIPLSAFAVASPAGAVILFSAAGVNIRSAQSKLFSRHGIDRYGPAKDFPDPSSFAHAKAALKVC